MKKIDATASGDDAEREESIIERTIIEIANV